MSEASPKVEESPPAIPGKSSSYGATLARFWAHAFALLALYLTVVIAWGQRNAWPDDLVLCVLLMPMGVLIASTLHAVFRFGFVLDSEKGQQEQLIAALILAVGLACGQVLLMTLGLVALGIAWLRPGRLDVDWTEWLKIPLILLTTLPFWLDFQGSRLGGFGLFDDPQGNPVYQLPLALKTTQCRVLAYCGLLSLVLLLHGRIFWIAVPILPAFLAGVTLLPRFLPGWQTQSALVKQGLPWLIGVLLLGIISWCAAHIDKASHRLVSGETLRRWFEQRRYPPWIAVLVVAVVQTLPFRSMNLGSAQVIGLGGTLIMIALLFFLRRRSRRGPIHSRSVAMVAGALVLTLMAEFATVEPLRRVAMGFVLIGLLSWHCFWPMRIFAAFGLASIVLLAIPDQVFQQIFGASLVMPARLGITVLLLGGLTWLVRRPLPSTDSSGYPEHAWIPSKRFAFILLGLMMLFQTAAAFWPDHEMERLVNASPTMDPGSRSGLPPMQTTGQPATYRLADETGMVHVNITFPRLSPYLLESPERWYRRYGWQVCGRERITQPHGEATALLLRREKDGREVTALWWFEQGRRTFSSHLYARRVLWSGWHMADRNLRLIRLESPANVEPKRLAKFAARYNWFESAWGQPLPVR